MKVPKVNIKFFYPGQDSDHQVGGELQVGAVREDSRQVGHRPIVTLLLAQRWRLAQSSEAMILSFMNLSQVTLNYLQEIL